MKTTDLTRFEDFLKNYSSTHAGAFESILAEIRTQAENDNEDLRVLRTDLAMALGAGSKDIEALKASTLAELTAFGEAFISTASTLLSRLDELISATPSRAVTPQTGLVAHEDETQPQTERTLQ